jgi:predicted transposase YdaD
VHEYDIALKSVLRRLDGKALAAVTGFAIERWHNVELPEVRSPRVDMLGETHDGHLVHIELQSTNDADMALRMAEYLLAIFRKFRWFPSQLVLYVGEGPLRMEAELRGGSASFRYGMVDVRELDGGPLLASSRLDDNILALLLSLGPGINARRNAVRRILQRIAKSEPDRRGVALRELVILAGLRSLGELVRQETVTMPILNDIMDHDLFGPAIRRGREEGLEKGRIEGEQTIVGRLIEKRFGPVPRWAQLRLEAMSAPEIERIALGLLDAESLEKLLG